MSRTPRILNFMRRIHATTMFLGILVGLGASLITIYAFFSGRASLQPPVSATATSIVSPSPTPAFFPSPASTSLFSTPTVVSSTSTTTTDDSFSPLEPWFLLWWMSVGVIFATWFTIREVKTSRGMVGYWRWGSGVFSMILMVSLVYIVLSSFLGFLSVYLFVAWWSINPLIDCVVSTICSFFLLLMGTKFVIWDDNPPKAK